MTKNKKKITYTCILYDNEYKQLFKFNTKIKCKTDVLRLCIRFSRLYKLTGKWTIQ